MRKAVSFEQQILTDFSRERKSRTVFGKNCRAGSDTGRIEVPAATLRQENNLCLTDKFLFFQAQRPTPGQNVFVGIQAGVQ